MNLRPYQQAAVDAVYNHLRSKDNNPCVVIPTAGGKSCILAQIAKDAVQKWNGRVLILAHVKELLEQNAGKIRKLCPELNIGIYSAGLKSRDTDEQIIVAGIQSVYNKACDLGAFDIVMVDECFPAGTMIDTPRGQIPIENLYVGQPVCHALGVGNIKAISSRPARELIELELSNGRRIKCTQNHPFFSEYGWCAAGSLAVGTRLYSREDVSGLRKGVSSEDSIRYGWGTSHLRTGMVMETPQVLRPGMSGNGIQRDEMECRYRTAGNCLEDTGENGGEILPMLRKGNPPAILPWDPDREKRLGTDKILLDILLQEGGEPDVQTGSRSEGFKHAPGDGVQAGDSWRQWDISNTSTGADCEYPRSNGRDRILCGNDQKTEGRGRIKLLQAGCCDSVSSPGNSVGWKDPFIEECEEIRQGNESLDGGIRVVNITHIKLESPCVVYNLQIEGHPSYYADGVLVHNCHLIPPEGEGTYQSFLKDMKIINPHVRVIGLTATPFRLKGGLICKPENILNEVCYEIGIKEMITQGYLSPMVSRAGKTEAQLEHLHIRAGEFIADEVESAMNKEEVTDAACREIARLTTDRKTVLIFCTSVAHCLNVAEKIRQYTGHECAIVTGETPAQERADIIARLRGNHVPADLFGTPMPPLKYCANVSVMTTGLDVPNIDCVVMLRPTASPGLLLQCAGRGFRLSPETGKENCLSEGTMILTDVGLVPIEKITKDMLLWDGVEFVHHDGIIYRGVQNVITYAGLTATPDHKVYYQHHWRTFQASAEGNAPICVTEHNGMPVRETDGCFRRGNNACGRENRTKAYSCSDSMSVWSHCMEKLGQCKEKHCGMPCLRQTTSCTKMVDTTSRICERQMRKSPKSKICGLWRTRNKILFQWPDRYGALANGTLRLFKQKHANRQNQQRWQLRAEQFKDDYTRNKYDEQKTSSKSKDVIIQGKTSGNPLCRFNSVSTYLPGIEQRGNNQEIQHTITQTQRRVWDILNAGPRHRFTANGLLVSNCLFLDFGGNILRHGPLDMIRVKEPGAGKGGDAPAKKCPKCLALIHAAYATCPECGYEFPPPEKSNLSEHASSAGIISGQVDYNDYDVQGVYYAVHEKRYAEPGTPRTMRIDYRVSFDDFKSEWVCPEHTGYARDKFLKWWRERAAIGCTIPETAAEAVALANQGLLAEPESITVKSVAGEKFDRITGWRLKPRPVMREPGDDTGENPPEFPSNSPEDLGVCKDDPDEIPF